MARGGGGNPTVFQNTGVVRTVAHIRLFLSSASFILLAERCGIIATINLYSSNSITINSLSQVGDSLPKEMWHQLELMEKRIELFAEEEEEEEADIY